MDLNKLQHADLKLDSTIVETGEMVIGQSDRNKLAIAIFAACQRMYPYQYGKKTPKSPIPPPEVVWHWLDPGQRELYLHYADAAAEFFAGLNHNSRSAVEEALLK